MDVNCGKPKAHPVLTPLGIVGVPSLYVLTWIVLVFSGFRRDLLLSREVCAGSFACTVAALFQYVSWKKFKKPIGDDMTSWEWFCVAKGSIEEINNGINGFSNLCMLSFSVVMESGKQVREQCKILYGDTDFLRKNLLDVVSEFRSEIEMKSDAISSGIMDKFQNVVSVLPTSGKRYLKVLTESRNTIGCFNFRGFVRNIQQIVPYFDKEMSVESLITQRKRMVKSFLAGKMGVERIMKGRVRVIEDLGSSKKRIWYMADGRDNMRETRPRSGIEVCDYQGEVKDFILRLMVDAWAFGFVESIGLIGSDFRFDGKKLMRPRSAEEWVLMHALGEFV